MRRIAILMAVIVAGCGGDSKKDTIKVGAALPQTGVPGGDDLSSSGINQTQGLLLALEEINKAGGVLGKQLELVLKDDGSDPAVKAKTAATALVAAQVPVVFAGTTSDGLLAVGSVTVPAKIPTIGLSSTSPAITSQMDDGYLFRTCPSDTVQGKLLAKRANEKGFKKVAIIHISGAYGEGLRDSFSSSFTALGGTVTSAHQLPDQIAEHYVDMLTEIYKDSPEAIVLIAYVDAAKPVLVDYVDQFASRDTFWFFTDGVKGPDFIPAVGASKFTFKHEGTGIAEPTSGGYVTRYMARYGTAPSPGDLIANAYDAMYLAALAIEAAGKSDSTLVKDKLTEVSKGGTPFGPEQYAAAIAAIKAGQDIDYQGVSGNVDFDANGDVDAPYLIWAARAIRWTSRYIW